MAQCYNDEVILVLVVLMAAYLYTYTAVGHGRPLSGGMLIS